jgi:hypothetical protein
MPLRLRSAGGGSVQLNPPVATSTDVVMEVPAYDGAKVLTNKTPGVSLQTLSFSLKTAFSTSSTSYVDIGASCPITLQKSSNKVLLLARIPFDITRYGFSIRVKRNGTVVYTPDSPYEIYGDPSGPSNHRGHWVINLLDSPGTTSATYTFEAVSYTGNAFLLMEGIYPALFTLQEIAA